MNHNKMLLDFINKKKNEDNDFSLRKYAKSKGISASYLSQILAGKKKLSYSFALKIVKDLNLNLKQKKQFLHEIKFNSSKGIFKVEAEKNLKNDVINFSSISADQNPHIVSWQALLILELTYLPNFDFNSKNISEALNLSEDIVNLIIEKLVLSKLLIKKNKKYFANDDLTMTTPDIPSNILKQNLHQMLYKASSALVTQTIEEREFFSVIMSIAKKDLPSFKTKLRDFQIEVINEFGNNKEVKDAVYAFQVQLFKLC